MAGRTIAIGDIHGCAKALEGLLDLMKPLPEDLIIPLGDYVDRGPESKEVIDLLIRLRRCCTLFPLLGNHEEMMLEARRSLVAERMWRACGGLETLDSYAPEGEPRKLSDVPDAHWRFLEKCKDFLVTDTHFFVHANALPDLQIAEQSNVTLRWQHLEAGHRAHCSGKVMICGHTPQESGLPLHLGHTICIDTLACGGGWLTGLEVEQGLVHQASQSGKTRTFCLAEVAPPGC